MTLHHTRRAALFSLMLVVLPVGRSASFGDRHIGLTHRPLRAVVREIVPVDRVARPAELPPTLAREFRGAWSSPLGDMIGADWPSRPGLSPEDQRAQLVILLDHARAIGLNAVILHVRMAGDALYPSLNMPWSAYLSGTSGVGPKPEYDPLAFAITEAHARGLQLHAWFNPFRAMLPVFSGRAAATHVTRAHKSWIRKYGKQTWIDPGEPAARASVLNEILDVVGRYDLDGVHLDDYFYPYRERQTITKRVNGRRVRISEDIPFPDAATWKKYGEKIYSDREDWRRSNIDSFVEQLYAGVKKKKPWVMVGISPFGIWRSGTPEGVTGLDAYGEIYADARKWLSEGWVDYLAPQLYWPLDGVQSRFTALDAWWRTQNPKNRSIWPGLFTAQVTAGKPGWSGGEILAEIARLRYSRDLTEEAVGHIHFRLGALLRDGRAVGERLRTDSYVEPAIVPAAPWLGGAPPIAPRVVAVDGALNLTPGDRIPVAWWLVQTRMADGRWRSVLRRSTERRIDLGTFGDLRTVAVSAMDRVGQLSAAVVLDVR